jgi:hypothetical protein
MEEHETRLKLLQQKHRNVSNVTAVKCSESAKESLVLDGSKLSQCKTLTTRSCKMICCNSDAVCSGEKNKLKSSSTDSDVVVAVSSQNVLQSVSKLYYANANDNKNSDSASPLDRQSNLSLRGTQNKERVSLSNEVSFSGASVAGHFDGLSICGEKYTCNNRLSSQSNLHHVNSDAGKKERASLSTDLGHEHNVAKFKSKHLSGRQRGTSGICQSYDIFTLHSWDSAINTHPIESDEWLAFLQRTMEEVMEGDVEAMLQCNFVGVIVSPLRNPGASCRVVEYVACLLSLPFVVNGVSEEEISEIKQVTGIFIVRDVMIFLILAII